MDERVHYLEIAFHLQQPCTHTRTHTHPEAFGVCWDKQQVRAHAHARTRAQTHTQHLRGCKKENTQFRFANCRKLTLPSVTLTFIYRLFTAVGQPGLLLWLHWSIWASRVWILVQDIGHQGSDCSRVLRVCGRRSRRPHHTWVPEAPKSALWPESSFILQWA